MKGCVGDSPQEIADVRSVERREQCKIVGMWETKSGRRKRSIEVEVGVSEIDDVVKLTDKER